MKVRQDFVTNSSSASYIVTCDEILNKEKLEQWLVEEYGKLGKQVFEQYVVNGEYVLNEKSGLIKSWNFNFNEEDFADVDPSKEYIYVYEDIEGGNTLASLASDLYHPELLKNLFSGSWSGFDG